jgi:hypothetical protein
MKQGARVKHDMFFQERLNDKALHFRSETADLLSGMERELLLKRADQAEKASHISAWLSSPGLRPRHDRYPKARIVLHATDALRRARKLPARNDLRNWRERCETSTGRASTPISKATRAPQRAPRICGDLMGGADNPKWMSDQNIGHYHAIADECYARAEHARYVPDKEAWLKLAAEWIALAEDSLRRRSSG